MSSITMATSAPTTSAPGKMDVQSPATQSENSTVGRHGAACPPTSVWPSTKVRNICWTWNNYKDSHIEPLKTMLSKETSYSVFGFERGDSGTSHLQGYSEFRNSRWTGDNWNNFKKLWNCSGVHFEIRRGSARQASDYCKYDDYPGNLILNVIWECGEISKQGHRTDWDVAISTLASSPVTEVIQAQPQLLPAIRALERFKQLSLLPIEREVHVVVLYGSAGSGKTRYVFDNYPDAFSKPEGNWWDGYEGEDVILLDDYYGSIPYCEFLKVLDRYKYRVPVKGGYVAARWSKVFITSNEHPDKWYGKYPDALKRRIHEIKFLDVSINGAQLS